MDKCGGSVPYIGQIYVDNQKKGLKLHSQKNYTTKNNVIFKISICPIYGYGRKILNN